MSSEVFWLLSAGRKVGVNNAQKNLQMKIYF